VEQNRLAKAKLSDKTVFIRTEEEALANSTSTATKTWHFKQNARFVWASSAAFILDGAKINLPREKNIPYQLIRLRR
jgi:chaperone required for assembly of F1-ATPase